MGRKGFSWILMDFRASDEAGAPPGLKGQGRWLPKVVPATSGWQLPGPRAGAGGRQMWRTASVHRWAQKASRGSRFEVTTISEEGEVGRNELFSLLSR